MAGGWRRDFDEFLVIVNPFPGGADDGFADDSGCSIRRFCVCGFRLHCMDKVGEVSIHLPEPCQKALCTFYLDSIPAGERDLASGRSIGPLEIVYEMGNVR